MSNLNKKAVRQLILDRAKVIKPGWPAERVSNGSLDFIDRQVQIAIDGALRRHPTVGKTVMLE